MSGKYMPFASTAEGVMRAMAEKQGVADRLDIDSAGLYGGHAGDLPDKRMRVHAFQRGYSLTHRSRPVKISDYDDFDLIVGQAESTVHMLNWAIRSVKFLGVEFDQSEDEEVSVSDTTHL